MKLMMHKSSTSWRGETTLRRKERAHAREETTLGKSHGKGETTLGRKESTHGKGESTPQETTGAAAAADVTR